MEKALPAPSLRELSRPTGVTEGVSSDEWYSVKSSEFRRGDESRPHPRILASTRLNGTYPLPAPSLRELSRPTGVTEGVSSDGSTGPMVCEPAHIGSEIFERLRSPKYTPSVSHSLDSSLKEGAGMGLHHSSCRPETGRLRAIFIAPTKLRSFYIPPFIGGYSLREGAGEGCTIQSGAEGCGRFSSPLRSSDSFTLRCAT